MKQPLLDEQLVRRYLLGNLPRRERERLEAGLLTDDRYYEKLTALEDKVEDDLIDEYLDGELTETDQENFKRVFLNTPQRTHKLKVIRDLKEQAALVPLRGAPVPKTIEPGPTYSSWIPAFAIFQNPIFGLSTAAALTLALLACVWLWVRSTNLESQLRQARAGQPSDSALREEVEQLNRRNGELAAKLQRSEEESARLKQSIAEKSSEMPPTTPPGQPTPPTRSTFASLTLSPGISRSPSDEIPTLTLEPHHTEGRLYLNVQRANPKDYKRVVAVVKNSGSDEVWRNDGVKLTARGINARALLIIPADRLPDGQYIGELDGITLDEQTERLGSYVFRVQHK